jgi:hypothetical protein
MHARRAANMPLLVEELAARGALRAGLSIREAADDIWALNSTEMYALLVRTRGWSDRQYRTWLSSRLGLLLFGNNHGET